MGIVRTPLAIRNPQRPELAELVVDAMADTGSMYLCIPEHVAVQMAFETLETREVTLADGRRRSVPYVGPVQLTFGNRGCYVGALVLGTEVLLGAVPMEDMDLVVSPATRTVTVNPNSPNVPSGPVMSTGC